MAHGKWIFVALLMVAQAVHAQEQTNQVTPIPYDVFFNTAAELALLREKRIISAEQLLTIMREEKDFFLVDVRDKADYESQHIKGAINIPLSSLIMKDVQKIIPDKKMKIIVYCKNALEINPTREAGLSMQAFPVFYQLGYENLHELASYSVSNLENLPFIETEEAKSQRCDQIYFNKSPECYSACMEYKNRVPPDCPNRCSDEKVQFMSNCMDKAS
ncbi:MAG: rhodanese-like domain-containing protein [Alphaproteobacteria bacterium]|nr:rhodanese-like domain-containing protein [Alphaproteobacteria bacterium]